MKTAWSHLPNAVHIDRVIASLKANPDDWRELYERTFGGYVIGSEGSEIWKIAYEVGGGNSGIVSKVLDDADPQNRSSVAYFVAAEPLVALVAYDDCAYMLDSDPGELELLAAFGDPRAILLMPACIVFNKEKLNK